MRSLEYSAPESLPEPSTGQLLQVDSKADMWSLGMILHKLLFFRLPYLHTSDNDDPSRPRDGREYSDKLEVVRIGQRRPITYYSTAAAAKMGALGRVCDIFLTGEVPSVPADRASAGVCSGLLAGRPCRSSTGYSCLLESCLSGAGKLSYSVHAFASLVVPLRSADYLLSG